MIVVGLGVSAFSGLYATPKDATPELSPAEHAFLADAAKLQFPFDPKSLPVPPDGWYTLELGGDTIQIFRDEYGVPHVFAPSVQAAFRAQGYVIAEDRAEQMKNLRHVVRGMCALRDGDGGIGHDTHIRIHGYTDDELEAMFNALRPDQRGHILAYLDGMNTYFARYAPESPPATPLDIAAGSVYQMDIIGDLGGGEDFDIFKLATMVKFLKGDQFFAKLLHDALPLDVPTAPTSDHSNRDGNTYVLAAQPKQFAPFEPQSIVAILEQDLKCRERAREYGVIEKWGSQAWTVRPERSASGKAMLFATPFMGFGVPSPCAQVHLVAPGLEVAGMCFMGVPGVVIGHNDRLAWGVTSAMVKQTDIFVEELNPDNPLQYKHNGQWKDIETFDRPIAVKTADGSLRIQPCTTYRTVHGPVVHWEHCNNRAYTRCSPKNRLQLQSFMGLIDLNFARDFDDVEQAVRQVATSQNFVAADVDGNIGYWLAGRLPNRHPDQDRRLPTPGTGEYDWTGATVATDVVSCINPPEGWLQSANNKPSVKIEGWWPELLWGHRIYETLDQNDHIDLATFSGINRLNGQHHFVGPFLKPYLLRLLRERADGEPQILEAIDLLEAWPSSNVPGASAALLFNEWVMETMVELLSPDLGVFVERSMELHNLQLFGPLVFRILDSERAGFPLEGDYLHGRNKDDLAFDCFKRVLDRLVEEHGPYMQTWPFDHKMVNLPGIGTFAERMCGVFWMAAELGDGRIRTMNTMSPGQSGLPDSPHYADQFDNFLKWHFRQTPFHLDEFKFPAT